MAITLKLHGSAVNKKVELVASGRYTAVSTIYAQLFE
jgi:hypothetical protein